MFFPGYCQTESKVAASLQNRSEAWDKKDERVTFIKDTFWIFKDCVVVGTKFTFHTCVNCNSFTMASKPTAKTNHDSDTDTDEDEIPHEMYEKDTSDVLLAKAIGLKSADDTDLFDCKVEPFVSARTKSKWKPSRTILNNEVLRRYNSVAMKPSARPPGNNWPVGKSMQWLKENPITDKTTISEIRTEVALFKADLLKDKETEESIAQYQWRNDIVYLHLIHCLIEDDDIRSAYIRSFDALDRDSLDRRKSAPMANPYEMIAIKMNDVNFCPSTEPYPDLHPSFKHSKDLSHHLMGKVGTIDEKKVREKINKLRISLTRIISNWTRSGQGFGAKGDEVPFGDVTKLLERPENDNRSSFLRDGDEPYILYLWQKSYETDFLSTMIQRIDPAVGAASGHNVVSVYPAIGSKKKRVVSPTNEADDGDEEAIGKKS